MSEPAPGAAQEGDPSRNGVQAERLNKLSAIGNLLEQVPDGNASSQGLDDIGPMHSAPAGLHLLQAM